MVRVDTTGCKRGIMKEATFNNITVNIYLH